jgi:hypothetical protein
LRRVCHLDLHATECKLPAVTPMRSYPITRLAGREILRWVGTEWALSWRESWSTSADGTTVCECSEVVWRDASIPYAQFDGVDIHLSDSTVLNLRSEDDGNAYYRLYLTDQPQPRSVDSHDTETSLSRVRELPELPTGPVEIIDQVMDGGDAPIEFRARVGTIMLEIIAGRVEDEDGVLRVLQPEDMVLIRRI